MNEYRICTYMALSSIVDTGGSKCVYEK